MGSGRRRHRRRLKRMRNRLFSPKVDAFIRMYDENRIAERKNCAQLLRILRSYFSRNRMRSDKNVTRKYISIYMFVFLFMKVCRYFFCTDVSSLPIFLFLLVHLQLLRSMLDCNSNLKIFTPNWNKKTKHLYSQFKKISRNLKRELLVYHSNRIF